MSREKVVEYHTIKNERPVMDETIPSQMVDNELGFTKGVSGEREPKHIEVDDVDCYAKMKFVPSEDGGPMMLYFIKMGISGFLFDPWGLYTEGTQAKDAKHLGRNAWEFTRVNKQCFNYYIRFLMTRNKAYLNLCEREVRSNA